LGQVFFSHSGHLLNTVANNHQENPGSAAKKRAAAIKIQIFCELRSKICLSSRKLMHRHPVKNYWFFVKQIEAIS
jgi:hypothetical protein